MSALPSGTPRSLHRGVSLIAGTFVPYRTKPPAKRCSDSEKHLGAPAGGWPMTSSSSSDTVVLVVEDEILIRTDMAEALTRLGYVVLQAANADEAIRVMEHRNDVRVVFTDVEMP